MLNNDAVSQGQDQFYAKINKIASPGFSAFAQKLYQRNDMLPVPKFNTKN